MVGVNLNEQVLSTVEYLRPEIADENIYLSLILFTELWRTRIEPVDIHQLLVTLLADSFESLRGGGRITIETANLPLSSADGLDRRLELIPGDYVLLSLTNSSAGLSTSANVRLVKTLYKAGPSPGKPAAISASIFNFIRKSGGDIVRCNGQGPGKTISVFLPRCAIQATDDITLPQVGISGLK